MNIFRKAAVFSLVGATLMGGSLLASAAPQHGRHGHGGSHGYSHGRPGYGHGPGRPMMHRPGPPRGFHSPYVHHRYWVRGRRMPMEYWNRAYVVSDWGAYGLTAPPYGYQWRYVDGQYVLAAVATGLISSIILASALN